MKRGWSNQIMHHIDIDPAGAEYSALSDSSSFHEKQVYFWKHTFIEENVVFLDMSHSLCEWHFLMLSVHNLYKHTQQSWMLSDHIVKLKLPTQLTWWAQVLKNKHAWLKMATDENGLDSQRWLHLNFGLILKNRVMYICMNTYYSKTLAF